MIIGVLGRTQEVARLGADPTQEAVVDRGDLEEGDPTLEGNIIIKFVFEIVHGCKSFVTCFTSFVKSLN